MAAPTAMKIEPRKATVAVCQQTAARARRPGRVGRVVLQILFVAGLAWISYEMSPNASENLKAQRITAGFGFLANTAGFNVSQNLIPYSGSDTYTRVFFVGLLNTLLVSLIGMGIGSG